MKTMKLYKIILTLSAICLFSSLNFGQDNSKKTTPSVQISGAVKATPAYAELLLRRAELESEVESLMESYTEEFPKVKSTKYELDLTKKDLAKLLTQTDTTKLSLSLGKLLVRKNEIETELWMLQNQYDNEYPQVKRTQRKLLSFQNAIKEIMP